MGLFDCSEILSSVQRGNASAEEDLSKAYQMNTQKLGLEKGWERQGKVLNCIVSCVDDGWTIEADPRHAELIVEQSGVEVACVAASPGVGGADDDDKDDDEDIVGTDLTRFRGVSARCKYLRFDRPDVQFATREICREMRKPTKPPQTPPDWFLC